MNRLFLFLLVFSAVGSAAPLDSHAALGLKLSTNLMRRGATLYDSYQVSPVIYLSAFEHRLQFFLNSLEYTDFLVGEQLRGRTKLATVSDRPLFVNGGHPRSLQNSRENSFEWTQALELFLPSKANYWAGVDFRYAQDLKAHGGAHFELMPRVTLAKFGVEKDRPRVQPQLFGVVGWGSGSHNRYQYGGSGETGFNYVSTGLLVLMPSRIDVAFWVFQAAYYRVLGEGNRKGELLEGKTDGIHLMAQLAFGLW